jgi:hypothetical protein
LVGSEGFVFPNAEICDIGEREPLWRCHMLQRQN